MNRREALKAALAFLAMPSVDLMKPKPELNPPSVWPEGPDAELNFWSPLIMDHSVAGLGGTRLSLNCLPPKVFFADLKRHGTIRT